MIPLVTLRELFAYNYWARDRQLEASAALSQEQFQRPMAKSFPSLRDTLAHRVDGEWLWLERCDGRSPRSLPAAEEFHMPNRRFVVLGGLCRPHFGWSERPRRRERRAGDQCQHSGPPFTVRHDSRSDFHAHG